MHHQGRAAQTLRIWCGNGELWCDQSKQPHSGRSGVFEQSVRWIANAQLSERHRRRPDECNAKLHRPQHANYPVEDRNFCDSF